jgi:hypothetical protein
VHDVQRRLGRRCRGRACVFDTNVIIQPESFAASCAPSITQSSWESVEQQLPTKWIPDHAVTHCMGCDRRFWGYNRKHHCRCVPYWWSHKNTHCSGRAARSSARSAARTSVSCRVSNCSNRCACVPAATADSHTSPTRDQVCGGTGLYTHDRHVLMPAVNTGGKQVCAGQVMSKHDDVRANGKASASELRVKVA